MGSCVDEKRDACVQLLVETQLKRTSKSEKLKREELKLLNGDLAQQEAQMRNVRSVRACVCDACLPSHHLLVANRAQHGTEKVLGIPLTRTIRTIIVTLVGTGLTLVFAKWLNL